MSITQRVADDLKTAMKGRDAERLGPLRNIKTALKNQEIEAGAPLDGTAEVQVLMRLAKQRRDSIEQYEKFGRPDLADAERRELTILESYLPAAPDEEEIRLAVDEAMAGDSARQMGPIMQKVMARFKGRPVDGKQVSALVRERLGG